MLLCASSCGCESAALISLRQRAPKKPTQVTAAHPELATRGESACLPTGAGVKAGPHPSPCSISRGKHHAITNQRVMIVMCLTGNPPAVFSYYRDEITVPEKVKRLDGAGILTFAEPRECKIGHTLPAFPLPGGFIGIFNVEMVATFLRMLQANSFSSARENGSSSVVKR